MGVSRTLTIVCDLSTCSGGVSGPQVLSWNETLVNEGKAEPPELAKYLVLFTRDGVVKSFCCQLHAAEYFLPPGQEIVQKKVIELPKPQEEPGPVLPWLVKKPVVESETWMDEPQRSENSPLTGQDQADGFGPETAS